MPFLAMLIATYCMISISYRNLITHSMRLYTLANVLVSEVSKPRPEACDEQNNRIW